MTTTTPTPAPAPMTARLRELEASAAELANKLADAAAHWRTKEFDDLCHANTGVIIEALRNAFTLLRLLEAVEGAEKALARLDVFWTAEFPEGPENPEPWGKINVQLSEETIAIWCGIRSALAALRAAREGAR